MTSCGQPAGEAALPVAGTTRWQPLRTGLVDIFHYDYQEFWFRDGRVLFRGNNGTGKSKVLALTLPFLLDGDLSPSRVEPDGDRDKKMEWNLLLGGKYEERIGYTWLEFGRVAEDGERLYLTVGCGLRAVRGRGIADRWFFVTAQRPGKDLFLSGNGAVLTKDRLSEAIGASGQVTQRAEHYRRLLDEQLFHLGPSRYDALVNLLIQLRQPQLSKRPDEGRLSQALTEALAPLDQAVLSDIAAAFHDLEEQRDQLAGLRATGRHVQRFTGRYRRYAAVAARRQARALRSEHAAYEQQQRDLASIRAEIGLAAADEQAGRTAFDNAVGELAQQNAAKEELAADPRMKSLDDAERYADQAERLAETTAGDAAKAQGTVTDRTRKRAAAVVDADASRAQVETDLATLRQAVGNAGVDAAPVLEALGLPDGPYDPAGIEALKGDLTGHADRRAQAIAHVTALAEDVAGHEQKLLAARQELSRREAASDVAADRLAAAQQEVEDSAARHLAAWQDFVGRTRALGPPGLAMPGPDEIGLADWAETLDGPPAPTASGRWPRSARRPRARSPRRARLWPSWTRNGCDSSPVSPRGHPFLIREAQVRATICPARHCGRSRTSRPV
jgi:hypothetical protein